MKLWMNSASDDQPASIVDGENKDASLYNALIGMIKFSQKHHSTNLPNPERLNCPPQRTLRALIESGKLPDDELRSHLYSCSECFRDYRATLTRHKGQVEEPVEESAAPCWKKVVWALSSKQRWVFASAISLLLLLLAGVQLQQRYREETPHQSCAVHGLGRAEDDLVSAHSPPQHDVPSPSTAVLSPVGPKVPKRPARSASRKRTPTPRLRPTGKSMHDSVAVTKDGAESSIPPISPYVYPYDLGPNYRLQRTKRTGLAVTSHPALPSALVTPPPARVGEPIPSESVDYEYSLLNMGTSPFHKSNRKTRRKAFNQRELFPHSRGISNMGRKNLWGITSPARRVYIQSGNKRSAPPKRH